MWMEEIRWVLIGIFFFSFSCSLLLCAWLLYRKTLVRSVPNLCWFQEQARKEKEELEKMLEENRRKVEEAQRREAEEQQRREEERYRELERIQREKEEAMRRKKQQEEEERVNQMKLLGKNKSRPKLSFAFGSKWIIEKLNLIFSPPILDVCVRAFIWSIQFLLQDAPILSPICSISFLLLCYFRPRQIGSWK